MKGCRRLTDVTSVALHPRHAAFGNFPGDLLVIQSARVVVAGSEQRAPRDRLGQVTCPTVRTSRSLSRRHPALPAPPPPPPPPLPSNIVRLMYTKALLFSEELPKIVPSFVVAPFPRQLHTISLLLLHCAPCLSHSKSVSAALAAD